MHTKRLKRKCSVRGCKNTASYVISRTRELGHSVILCRECLEQALNAIKVLESEENAALVNTSGFSCPNCGKLYKTEAGLKNHLERCGIQNRKEEVYK